MRIAVQFTEGGGLYIARDREHGFLYSNGNYTTLDEPLGAHGTAALASTTRARSSASIGTAASKIHGFLYSNGQYTTIDDPRAAIDGWTSAYGINDKGQIVGSYNDSKGMHGFPYIRHRLPINKEVNEAGVGSCRCLRRRGSLVGVFQKPSPTLFLCTGCLTYLRHLVPSAVPPSSVQVGAGRVTTP